MLSRDLKLKREAGLSAESFDDERRFVHCDDCVAGVRRCRLERGAKRHVVHAGAIAHVTARVIVAGEHRDDGACAGTVQQFKDQVKVPGEAVVATRAGRNGHVREDHDFLLLRDGAAQLRLQPSELLGAVSAVVRHPAPLQPAQTGGQIDAAAATVCRVVRVE